MNKRVVVGLSGGVDSSVAAYLLLQQGYEVIGIFMKNWHDTSVTISEDCPWLEDSNDALIVAEKLGIPFQTIDLSEAYRERIVDYMFSEYQNGRTPNPDVLCNREIKFDIFLNAAKSLGAHFVATGHYCQKEISQIDGENVYHLIAGKDTNKDQSYFLCQLNQAQLSQALFPIGHLTKPEVRAIASEQNLVTAEKKDSQGLCFIGKVRLPEFLQQQLAPKKGKIVEILPNLDYFKKPIYQFDCIESLQLLKTLTTSYNFNENDGKIIGEHQGAHYYTIGQRKGLAIGGYKLPLFILSTNTQTNTIYVGQGENHGALNRPGLFIPKNDIHWLRNDLELNIGEKVVYQCRIRYRQKLENVCLYMQEDGLHLIFENLQKAITPGQFATWYKNDELIGSGVIA